MTFQPVLPSGGLLGWRFLTRTLDTQQQQFSSNPRPQRDIAYFRENISSVKTAEALVSDRRLLRVAVGAFGLQDDINNKAFLQKILEGGTESRASLANRLADARYTEFSKAFGFGNIAGAQTSRQDFGARIIAKFEAKEFEVAVGQQDDNMRLALNAKRELTEMATEPSSDNTKWFQILGNPPLRAVFERALGLPTSFGQIDIEQQLETIRDIAGRRADVTSVSDFSDPNKLDRFVERFLLQAQVAEFSSVTSSAAISLTLLQNASA